MSATIKKIEELIEKSNLEECVRLSDSIPVQVIRMAGLSEDYQPLREYGDCEEQAKISAVQDYFKENLGCPFIPIIECKISDYVHRTGDFLVGIKFDTPTEKQYHLKFTFCDYDRTPLSTIDFIIPKGVTFAPLNQLPWHYKCTTVQVSNYLLLEGLPSNATVYTALIQQKQRNIIAKLMYDVKLKRIEGNRWIEMKRSFSEGINTLRTIETIFKEFNRIIKSRVDDKTSSCFFLDQQFVNFLPTQSETRTELKTFFDQNPDKNYLQVCRVDQNDQQFLSSAFHYLVGIQLETPVAVTTTATLYLVDPNNRVLSTAELIIVKGTTFIPSNQLPLSYRTIGSHHDNRLYYKNLPEGAFFLTANLNDELRSHLTGLNCKPEGDFLFVLRS